MQTRLADSGTVCSIGLFTWTQLAHLNAMLQTAALVVTIVAGTAAAAFHIQAFLSRKKGKV